jgi:hypothetical protein
MMAAVLACGPDSVLSYVPAAAHWTLWRSAARTMEVSVLRGRGRSRPGVRVHVVRQLDATVHRRIPITTVARTIVDLAEVLNDRGVERVIERAEMLGLFDLRKLEPAMCGRRGARKLERVLGLYRGHTNTKSDNEELLLAICRAADGVPEPDMNLKVEGHERDATWLRERVIVEIDARSTHDHPLAWEHDRLRDQTAIVAGWTVIRFTKWQLENDAGYVAATIRGLLTRPPS